MITCFETSLAASNSGRPGFAYMAVGTALDWRSQPAALPLVDELIRAAHILTSDDEESTGLSPILYHEVNKELGRRSVRGGRRTEAGGVAVPDPSIFARRDCRQSAAAASFRAAVGPDQAVGAQTETALRSSEP
jgi:hypothetical protein